MAFLDQNPAIGYPLVAGLGLLVGSFLNVVILRLPQAAGMAMEEGCARGPGAAGGL